MVSWRWPLMFFSLVAQERNRAKMTSVLPVSNFAVFSCFTQTTFSSRLWHPKENGEGRVWGVEIPTFIVIFIGSIHSRDWTSVPGQWDISYSGVGHQEGGKGQKFHLSRMQRKGTSALYKRWDIKTELGPVFYTRLDIRTELGPVFSKRWDIKTEKRDRRSIGTNCRGREPVFYRGRDTNTQYWNLCSTIKRWDVKTELGPVFYRKWDTKTEEGLSLIHI